MADDIRRHRPDPNESDLDTQGFMEKVGELISRETGSLDPSLVDIVALDREVTDAERAELSKAQKASASFFSDLIYTLAHIRYPEQEAALVWTRLLQHKWHLSELLGRNIGIRVAALDYFINVLKLIDQAKIIDNSDYIETAALAITDGLTGVFNHRYFQERLQRDLEEASREGVPLSLVMFDLDYFKLYNDINGHVAGDVALREFGRVLRRSVKKKDLVARYGGEEFCLIFYDVAKKGAVQIAERVRREIELTHFPNETVLPSQHLTVSAGVAEAPADASDRGGLIEAADNALYRAKKTGRNRVCAEIFDRRGYPRTRARFMLEVALVGRDQPWRSAEARDLALGGICFRADEMTEVGHVLRLRLPSLEKGQAGIELIGRSVWVQPRSDGAMQVGVKFVALDDGKQADLQRLLDKLGGAS